MIVMKKRAQALFFYVKNFIDEKITLFYTIKVVREVNIQ
jgi:hypothetical protein